MKNSIVKRIVWFVIVLVLAYAVYFIASDTQANLARLRAFPWQHLPIILGAVTANFLLRWVKWEWFRRAAGVDVPLGGSFLVYFSGLSMAISPGRVGELIKPFMYKEYFSKKMRRTIPLVFCERISDLIGMIILTVATAAAFASGVGASGRSVFHQGEGQGGISVTLIQGFLALTVVAMIALILGARSKKTVYWFLFGLGRRPSLSGPASKLRKLYFATYPLLTFKNLFIASAIGAVSWSFECLALHMILKGVGAEGITLAQATFVFCMATIFGGFLFFMPGGAVGFEGTMLAMLWMLGTDRTEAGVAIVIVRFCTLFFSVLLGFFFILMTSLRYHRRLEWEEFEHVSEKAEAEE